MTAYTLYIDSMVWDYHDYQSVWDNHLVDGDLLCEHETENSHYLQAMAIKITIDGTLQVVEGVCQGKYLQFVQYS